MAEGTIPQDTFDPVNDSPTALRTSMTRGYGATPAYIHEGRILNVNYVNWTVDVFSQFDMKFYPDIQVAAPYLHPNRGEGIYVMPDINAKCLVCIPSDGPPPFVLAFLASQERVGGEETDETNSLEATNPLTFASGRKRAKPGDIFFRGRDGNFITLHRGGVLQIGATEVAQRIYIPLRNLVTDISENYDHFNTGGCINWGISTGENSDNPETEWRQVFRLFAPDENGTIRVAAGKVHQPLPDDATDGPILSQLGIGDTVVYEFDIAPDGFNTETGAPLVSSANFKMVFDKAGGAFIRAEGSIYIRTNKRFKLVAEKGIDLETEEDFNLSAGKKGRITAKKSLDIGTSGGILSFNSGKDAVAHVGSIVEVAISVPSIAQALADPTITSIQAAGSVTTGKNKTLV